MAQAQANHTHAPTLQAPAVADSIRAEIRAAKDLPDGVPPPETVEQARQTTGIWVTVAVALVIAGLLLAVFSM